jgi:hypothetical protein
VIAKAIYTATNPVLDDLVERVDHWPGAKIVRAVLLREPIEAGFDGLASVSTFDVMTASGANWTVDFVVGFDGLWPDGSFAQGGFVVSSATGA